MARAKKCDICGRLYELYNDKRSDYPNFIEFDCELSEGRGRKIVYRYDTCPDCMEAIGSLIYELQESKIDKADFIKIKFNLPLEEDK